MQFQAVPAAGGSPILSSAQPVSNGAGGQVISGQGSGTQFNVSARYVDASGNPLSDWNAATAISTG